MPAVSVSMLYKFRAGEYVLGRGSVNALAPLLVSVTNETWLAAMGVERTEPEAEIKPTAEVGA